MQGRSGTRGTEVTAVVTAWIETKRRGGATFQEIANELGVTKTQVIHVHAGTRGVGPVMEASFAKREFGGSVDALRKAAREAWEANEAARPSEATLPPFLRAAIEAMRTVGPVPDVVVDKLRQMSKGGDLQVATWCSVISDLLKLETGGLSVGRSPRAAS